MLCKGVTGFYSHAENFSMEMTQTYVQFKKVTLVVLGWIDWNRGVNCVGSRRVYCRFSDES